MTVSYLGNSLLILASHYLNGKLICPRMFAYYIRVICYFDDLFDSPLFEFLL